MSGQAPTGHHKVRRNVSPSQTQRQGPLKAVQAFTLIPKGSPTRSPSSPVQNVTWRSPGPENIPRSPGPGSPSAKAERSKPRLSPASSSLRRTGSLDTIGPYLKGQWPVDIQGSHNHQTPGSFMLDKGTQTPENLHAELTSTKSERRKKKKHRRSASFGHGDRALVVHSTDKKLEVNRFRQILQKKKDQGTKPRESPITGNHNALSMTAPAILIRSAAIGIPAPSSSHIPRTSMSRYQRNSVEGLNHEIEKFSFMTISGGDYEELIEVPDGHRAPVPDVVRTSSTRNVDTQTPSGIPDGQTSGRSSDSPPSQSSRPQSVSPTILIIPGPAENSPRPNSCNSSGSTPRSKSEERDSITPDGSSKVSSASPKPNKIVREPPDGCEKVKAFDEDKSGKAPSIKEPLLFCPIQGRGEFVLKPSISSAFCPLTIYSQGSCFSQTSRQSTILESQ